MIRGNLKFRDGAKQGSEGTAYVSVSTRYGGDKLGYGLGDIDGDVLWLLPLNS